MPTDRSSLQWWTLRSNVAEIIPRLAIASTESMADDIICAELGRLRRERDEAVRELARADAAGIRLTRSVLDRLQSEAALDAEEASGDGG